MKKIEIISRIKFVLAPEQFTLVDKFLRFDCLNIDESRLSLYEKNDFVIIDFFSERDESCPFAFDFGIKANEKQFRFYLNKSAPIIEEELTDDLLLQTIENVGGILSSEIIEELTCVNDKIVKAKYKYYSIIQGERILIPFVTFRKTVWFWQRKVVTVKKYKSWLFDVCFGSIK